MPNTIPALGAALETARKIERRGSLMIYRNGDFEEHYSFTVPEGMSDDAFVRWLKARQYVRLGEVGYVRRGGQEIGQIRR